MAQPFSRHDTISLSSSGRGGRLVGFEVILGQSDDSNVFLLSFLPRAECLLDFDFSAWSLRKSGTRGCVDGATRRRILGLYIEAGGGIRERIVGPQSCWHF